MQQLAVKIQVSEDLIRHKFLKSLPANISAVLASQKDLSLTQLGKLADELLPYLNPSANTMAVSTAPSRQRSNSPHPRSEKFMFNGLKPFSPDQKPKICRGHVFFAEKSRTCRNWCKWPSKNNCRVLNSRASSPASRSSSPVRRSSENE